MNLFEFILAILGIATITIWSIIAFDKMSFNDYVNYIMSSKLINTHIIKGKVCIVFHRDNEFKVKVKSNPVNDFDYIAYNSSYIVKNKWNVSKRIRRQIEKMIVDEYNACVEQRKEEERIKEINLNKKRTKVEEIWGTQ